MIVSINKSDRYVTHIGISDIDVVEIATLILAEIRSEPELKNMKFKTLDELFKYIDDLTVTMIAIDDSHGYYQTAKSGRRVIVTPSAIDIYFVSSKSRGSYYLASGILYEIGRMGVQGCIFNGKDAILEKRFTEKPQVGCEYLRKDDDNWYQLFES